MGAQHQAHQQSQHKAQSQPPHLTGLASNMRPMFFRDDLSGLLSGKAFGPSKDPMPFGSKGQNVPISSPSSVAEKPIPTPGHAMLAAVASQTLLGKLGSAFWEAFSGSSSPSLTAGGSPHYFSANGGSKPPAWDADKVRKVLEGKAVVKVVDVEPVQTKVEPPSSPKLVPAPPSKASSTSKWASSRCPRHQERLAKQEVADRCSKVAGEKGPEKRCEWEKCVHDLLEENFRTLSLGKKA
jgi:bZIP-type transcription factor MBZ1